MQPTLSTLDSEKRINFKTLGKLAVFFLCFFIVFFLAQNVLKLNMGHRGTDNVKGFYALDENTVDVLVVGASTAFCTVDPIVLYQEYGITSYDFASSAQILDLSELFINEALKTQKPKVLALEVLSLYRELDVNKANDLNYGLTDLEFSPTKIRGVYNMFREDEAIGLSYLIPIVQYKDRWQELSRQDFVPWKDPMTMGAYTPDKISEDPLDFSEYWTEKEKEAIPERNLEIIRRIKATCDREGISLVAFKSPNVGWTLGRSMGAMELCNDLDIPFINFFDLMDELSIDPALDFRDNTHLNITGSRKTSIYFGNYLKENYELPDERGTVRGNRWQQALENRTNPTGDD